MYASKRQDGRSMHEARKMKARTGTFVRADGSSELQLGNTHVQCTVYGPAHVAPNLEKLDGATVQVNVQPLIGYSATTAMRNYEALISGLVNDVLLSKMYPRTLVQVILQIVCDDGSVSTLPQLQTPLYHQNFCLIVVVFLQTVSGGLMR
jgi:exosome complex component RRP46